MPGQGGIASSSCSIARKGEACSSITPRASAADRDRCFVGNSVLRRGKRLPANVTGIKAEKGRVSACSTQRADLGLLRVVNQPIASGYGNTLWLAVKPLKVD